MIISFEIQHPMSSDIFHLIPKDKKADRRYGIKEVSYYKTVCQLDELQGIHSIIVPSSLEGWMYDIRLLLDNLRLSDNNSVRTAAIYILQNSDDLSYIDRLEYHGNYSVEVINKDDTELTTETLSPEKWQEIFRLIGNEPVLSGRHALANYWGAYKLLNGFIKLCSEAASQYLLDLTDVLSEDIYFRKKLYIEKESENALSDKYKDKTTAFKVIVSRAKGIHILVIEDQLLFPGSDKYGWKPVYQEIFKNSNIELSFISNKKTALMIETKKYDLVLLDLRLEEFANPGQREALDIRQLSGIEVLQSIKMKDPSLPVIVTTASNKSWSAQAALSFGADGYWIKESPEFTVDLDFTMKNTNLFFNLLNSSLSWALKVRDFVQIAYSIPELIDNKFKNALITASAKRKCHAFIGLIHKPESEFIRDFTQKAQIELSFLEIFGLMNDILSLVVDKENDQYFLKFNGKREVLPKNDRDDFFNEKGAMISLISKLQNSSVNKFYELYNIRNGLGEIHGREYVNIDTDRAVTEPKLEDIGILLQIYSSILEKL